ncbi:MAG: 16S rRNA (adenine(1518)-N(6)/adenine(1519)-N(6))-dimethyltransferase RsmA [Bacteroidota bacterium]
MDSFVKPKKSLGQHFLKDKNIAVKIVDSLSGHENYNDVVEVGPGMGVLSDILIERQMFNWYGIEVDRDSVAFLKERYPKIENNIIEEDFLKVNFADYLDNKNFAVIGNFPYNISTQILFKILENHKQIPEMVGMFQKEVAMRVCAGPGSKTYGILSVLCKAFYTTEWLFHVSENVFIPPPKVKSTVIRMQHKTDMELPCSEKLLFSVVKTAFNQRRKTLRNSLKGMQIDWSVLPESIPGKRPEQLDVEIFFDIANAVLI